MKTVINFISVLLISIFVFTGCEYTDKSSEQNLSTLPTVFDEEFSSDINSDTIFNNEAPHIISIRLNNDTELLNEGEISNIDLNGEFIIYFDQAMDMSGIHQGSVQLKYEDDKGAEITIDSQVGNESAVRVSLTDGIPLLNGTRYTLSFSNEIKSINGNFITPFEVSFTTQSFNNDTTSPIIISSTPENQGTNAFINGNIIIRFNESLDAQSITQSSIEVQNNLTQQFVIFHPSVNDNIITFTPENPLEYGTLYDVAVNTNIQDSAGNYLENRHFFHFTTQDMPIENTVDLIAPVFTSATSYSVDENQLTAFTAMATDNLSTLISYTILSGYDKSSFDITSSSGEILFISEPDFETKSVYTLNIRATDEALNYVEQIVNLNIQNINERPTAQGISGATVGMDMTSSITLLGSDEESSPLTYSIVSFPSKGSVSINGNIASFTASAGESGSDSFWYKVNDGIKDSISALVTLNIVDQSGPVVINATPLNNALGIRPDTNITLTFNEALEPSSITDFSVHLLDTNGLVSGSVLLQGQTLIFTPTTALNYDMQYTINVQTSITDIAGNVVDDTYGSVFTTGSFFELAPLGHLFSGVNGNDFANDAVMDNAGFFYVTGATTNLDNDLDMIVAKYRPDGTLDTTFNGSGFYIDKNLAGGCAGYSDDVGNAIALDSMENIYITGYSTSCDNPQNTDMAIWMFSPTGVRKVATSYASIAGEHNDTDEGNDIAIDSNNNIYVTGVSHNGTDSLDMYLSKYTLGASGIVLEPGWTDIKKDIGSAAVGIDQGHALSIDQNDNIYVAAQSYNGNTFTFDIILLKYLSDGSMDSTFGPTSTGIVVQDIVVDGNSRQDIPRDIVLDSSNNIYVVGESDGESVLLKYSSNGDLDPFFGIGNSGYIINMIGQNNFAYSAALDDTGHIYVAGNIASSPDSMFTAKFDSENGSLISDFGTNGHVIYDNSNGASIAHTLILDSENRLNIFGGAYNNENSSTDLTFWRYNDVDTTPPIVLSTSPNNTGTMNTSSVITITFNEPLYQASIQAGYSVQLFRDLIAEAHYAYSTTPDTHIINIQKDDTGTPFTPGEYTCSITSDVLDTSGNRLPISYSFSFTIQ